MTVLGAALGCGLALAPAQGATSSAAPARAPGTETTSYVNAVSRQMADTFADPSVIRGKDGLWYAFGTSDPLREGERTPHRLPVARSADLVRWTHVGDAFTDATLPAWAAPDAALWAPDIRYVDGEYRLYYVVTQTTTTAEPNDNAIGMATAPTPVGPWTDSGAPVVAPRHGSGGEGDFLWTFDPSVVTDRDGSQWIFYGSYYGGIHVAPLSADGRRVVGASRMVADRQQVRGRVRRAARRLLVPLRLDGQLLRRPDDGVQRPGGPLRATCAARTSTAQGVPLLQSRAGGTPVAGPERQPLGRRGTQRRRHRPRRAGLDRLPRDRPGGPLPRRAVRHQRAADAARPPRLGRRVAADARRTRVRARSRRARRSRSPPGRPAHDRPRQYPPGAWVAGIDPQSGAMLSSVAAGAVPSSLVVGPARTEADLRSARARYGLVQTRGSAAEVRLTVDPSSRTATLTQRHAGRPAQSVRAALPAGFDTSTWHSFSLEVRDGARAELSHARLGDPLVVLSLPGSALGRSASSGAAFAGSAGVGVDNLSSVAAATLVTTAAPTRVPSRLDAAAGDEFDGSALAPGWSWVRQDAAATVAGGVLRWPTEAADLTGDSDDAGIAAARPRRR